jgi:hypothetical protein
VLEVLAAQAARQMEIPVLVVRQVLLDKPAIRAHPAL